jgi:hypothetical protein|tara:strand:- start:2679 stop:3140 length:462 start_codon:yes stop_codon:yes gene_type:complete
MVKRKAKGNRLKPRNIFESFTIFGDKEFKREQKLKDLELQEEMRPQLSETADLQRTEKKRLIGEKLRGQRLAPQRRRIAQVKQAGEEFKQSFQRFGRQGQQEPDFTVEQESMASLFGQGGKIWGTRREPVRLNNDLHPSISDPNNETRSMFGF